MASYYNGKPQVAAWIRQNFSLKASILDVGACDGVWKSYLPEYECVTAVEAFPANAEICKTKGYFKVVNNAIQNVHYRWFDLIIFGDVIEHMSVEDAQKVLKYAKPRCKDMIIAVPFLYPQGELYGNPWEKHIQDDLTPELFEERYPGFDILYDPGNNYMYYHKKKESKENG